MYKLSDKEKIMETLCVDSVPTFLITRCKDRSYIIYKIDGDDTLTKLYKSDNPSILESKSGYIEMCERSRNEHE